MKTTLRFILISSLTALLCFAPLGCTDQATVASLIQTVGAAVSSLETIEGNAALASKLSKDFTLASQDVAAWKQGTPSQDVVEALDDLTADLSALPVSTQDAALIDLAATTISAIVTIIDAQSPALRSARAVTATPAPKTAKAFRTRWNQLLSSHPELNGAKLQ